MEEDEGRRGETMIGRGNKGKEERVEELQEKEEKLREATGKWTTGKREDKRRQCQRE